MKRKFSSIETMAADLPRPSKVSQSLKLLSRKVVQPLLETPVKSLMVLLAFFLLAETSLKSSAAKSSEDL